MAIPPKIMVMITMIMATRFFFKVCMLYIIMFYIMVLRAKTSRYRNDKARLRW